MSNQENMETSVIKDRCPAWANEMIHRIYVLEVEAGTIKQHQSSEWSTVGHEELLKIAARLENDAGPDLPADVEAIFARVVRGLLSENFDPTEIAGIINARIPTGCKLSYCSASEVMSAGH